MFGAPARGRRQDVDSAAMAHRLIVRTRSCLVAAAAATADVSLDAAPTGRILSVALLVAAISVAVELSLGSPPVSRCPPACSGSPSSSASNPSTVRSVRRRVSAHRIASVRSPARSGPPPQTEPRYAILAIRTSAHHHDHAQNADHQVPFAIEVILPASHPPASPGHTTTSTRRC